MTSPLFIMCADQKGLGENMERQMSKQGTPPIDLPIGSRVPPILLYFHPTMKGLAEQIVATIAQEHFTKTKTTNSDDTDVKMRNK